MAEADPRRWPCPACGASMGYAPGQAALLCAHCGHSEPLPETSRSGQSTVEARHDLQTALRGALPSVAMAESRFARCSGCGAELELGGEVKATTCPFCATPVVPEADPHRLIRPQAVLPFKIAEREARAAMVAWLGRLWFAPSGLQEYARKGRQLTGIYVPFWGFDADTRSQYRGQRGDAYYETRTVTVQENGRSVQRQERVRRIRWTPAAGRVSRMFEDVLVIGSQSLPREHTEALEPWDLGALEAFSDSYLGGFQAEAYTIGLEDGHDRARAVMESVIAQDVRRAIGGDEQRVEWVGTDWRDEAFRHILLPVWTAAYRYNGKAYRFVVNGQSGKVKGERPWSVWKIAAAVLVAGIVIGVAAWFGQNAR